MNNTLDCEFGPVPEVSDGKATRKCLAPRMWTDYYGEECITRTTHEVEQLREVKDIIYIIFCLSICVRHIAVQRSWTGCGIPLQNWIAPIYSAL